MHHAHLPSHREAAQRTNRVVGCFFASMAIVTLVVRRDRRRPLPARLVVKEEIDDGHDRAAVSSCRRSRTRSASTSSCSARRW